MRRYTLLPLTLLLLLLSYSCNTARRGVQKLSLAEQQFVEAMTTPDKAFHTFSAKASIALSLNGGKSLSSRATIRMVKDSLLQVSVQPFLGIELFKLHLTNDSLVVIDKTQQRYLAEPLQPLQKRLPITLNIATVEALLMGKLYLPEEGVTPHSLARCTLLPNTLEGYDIGYTSQHHYTLHYGVNGAYEVKRLTIDAAEGELSSQWSYGAYERKEGYSLPTKVSTNSLLKGVDLGVSISYQSPSWDGSWSKTTKIPTHYKRIKVEQLIELLKQ